MLSRKPRHTWLVSDLRGFRLADVRESHDEDPWKTVTSIADRGDILILQDGYSAQSSYGRDRMGFPALVEMPVFTLADIGSLSTTVVELINHMMAVRGLGAEVT